MNVTCPQCATIYRVDPAKVPEAGVRARCAACHDVFPEWAVPRYPGGTGADRQVFEKLRDRPWGSNNAPTVHYRIRLAKQHFYQLWRMKCAGVDLASFMAAADIPGDDVWQRCIAFERRFAAAPVAAGER